MYDHAVVCTDTRIVESLVLTERHNAAGAQENAGRTASDPRIRNRWKSEATFRYAKSFTAASESPRVACRKAEGMLNISSPTFSEKAFNIAGRERGKEWVVPWHEACAMPRYGKDERYYLESGQRDRFQVEEADQEEDLLFEWTKAEVGGYRAQGARCA